MSKDNIVGIYLAAGRSTRMGCNKLLLPLGGEILASIALKASIQAELNKLLVVTRPCTGLEKALKQKHGEHKKIAFVHNLASEKGISESLKCGVKAAQQMNADGVLIFLADQPFITTEIINNLITAFKTCHTSLFAAYSYENIIRPPIIIDRKLFPQIIKLSGDEGAKKLLLENHSGHGRIIHLKDDKPFLDIDTMEAYRKIVQMVEG